MDTNLIRTVLKFKEKLGLSEYSIRKAIENQLEQNGDNFLNLIQIAFQIDNSLKK